MRPPPRSRRRDRRGPRASAAARRALPNAARRRVCAAWLEPGAHLPGAPMTQSRRVKLTISMICLSRASPPDREAPRSVNSISPEALERLPSLSLSRSMRRRCACRRACHARDQETGQPARSLGEHEEQVAHRAEQNHLCPVRRIAPISRGRARWCWRRTPPLPCFSVIAIPARRRPSRRRGVAVVARTGVEVPIGGQASSAQARTIEAIIRSGSRWPRPASTRRSAARSATWAPGRSSTHRAACRPPATASFIGRGRRWYSTVCPMPERSCDGASAVLVGQLTPADHFGSPAHHPRRQVVESPIAAERLDPFHQGNVGRRRVVTLSRVAWLRTSWKVLTRRHAPIACGSDDCPPRSPANRASPADPQLSRFPHLAGDLLTFVAEDDIWLAPLSGLETWRVSTDHVPVSRPQLSPDGRRVAWTTRSTAPRAARRRPRQRRSAPPVALRSRHDHRPRLDSLRRTGAGGVARRRGEPQQSCRLRPRARRWGAGRLPYGHVGNVALAPGGAVLTATSGAVEVAWWKGYRRARRRNCGSTGAAKVSSSDCSPTKRAPLGPPLWLDGGAHDRVRVRPGRLGEGVRPRRAANRLPESAELRRWQPPSSTSGAPLPMDIDSCSRWRRDLQLWDGDESGSRRGVDLGGERRATMPQSDRCQPPSRGHFPCGRRPGERSRSVARCPG